MDPSANHAATMAAWRAAFEELQSHQETAGSVSQPEIIDPNRSLNIDKAALCNLVNDDVEHQVADCPQDPIVIAIEKTFMEAIKLAAHFVVLQKKSTFNGLFDVSISRVIESGRLDSYVETRLSSIVEYTMFICTII